MLTTLKPAVEKALQPVAHALRGASPNTISLLGLLFPVLFFWAVMTGHYVLALIVFVFNGVDLLDGMVARATGKVTAFGGLLDSTIDRFADFVVIAAFGFAGIVSWNIVLPLILASFLISYLRSRAELAAKGNLSMAVGLIERTERLILVFVALLLYMLFPNALAFGQNLAELVFIILATLSIFTIGQRFIFAYKKL
jgi:archaetidylinositol phosphate synthase